jgi:hypothetical protein
MKVEIGVSGSVLSQSFQKLGILATNSFVKYTWQFLAENNFTIVDQVGDLKLQRQGDEFLTTAFIRHGIRGRALRWMNMCQLYLQVDSLADITTDDGCYITWAVQQGCRDRTLPQYHRWPTQGDPGDRIWMEWRNTLAIVFCGGNLDRGILRPCGEWLEEVPDDWQWWFSLTEERVYHHLAGRWQFYSVHQQGQ